MYNGLFKNLIPRVAYWLGLIAADGYMTEPYTFDIGLKTSDGYLLGELSKDLGYDSSRIKWRANKYSGEYKLQISNKKLYSDLFDINFRPRKTRTINSLYIPKDYISHFIRGLFDGDGTVGIYNRKDGKGQRPRFGIYGHKPFIESILETGFVQGKVRLNRNDVYLISTTKHNDIIFNYNSLYNNADIWMKRKKRKFQECVNYINRDVVINRKYKEYIESNGQLRSYIVKICETCNKEYKCRSDKNSNYCSRQCSNLRYKKYEIYKNGRPYILKNCKICNEKYECRTDSNKKCCSNKCTRIYNKEMICQ